MPLCRRVVLPLCALCSVLIVLADAHASVKFQPVSPDELKMTSDPGAPGAPAIILYREVNRDDYGRSSHGGAQLMGGTSDRYEENYYRIKILTEDGRKYANVEIPLPREVGFVTGIEARTIRPDGSIVNYDGKVFEKTIYKSKGYQYLAKTLTLPDVQVGSIIEYFYTLSFREYYIFFSQWILSNELYTKKAKFTLRPYQNDYGPMSFRWNEHLPPGTASPKQGNDGIVVLEVSNIAAFRAEDFMPPENELKARVDFIYSSETFEADANSFWKKIGKKRNNELESFVGKRGAMDQALSQIVAPSDSPDVKLHKIYTRVQQLHNTSFEVRKTEQEQKRDNKKTEENVEDVWKQGSGDQKQLNWLCLALARAAGIEAYGVWVSDRSNYFFNPQTMQSGKLDRSAVLVKLGGKDVYLAPGSAFAPFGLLPWEETGVQGLRLDKDGGSWIQTNLPESAASRIERKADLTLSADGTLEGKVTVSFTGLEALRRRVDERSEDEAARKKYLEDQVKAYIPVGSEADLTQQPEWTNSEVPLTATFSVKVPGWASVSGRRALMPVGLFSASERHVFEYSNRTYPVYYEFLSQKADDLTIKIPAGWQISAVPPAQNHDLHVVGYAISAENASGTLHVTRKVEINTISIDQKYYAPLRSFYQIVKAGDDQQIVLLPGSATASN